MVTIKTSKPAYSLAEIVRFAGVGCVRVWPKALNDIENLGYSPEDMYDCLRNLRPHHYHETILYDDDESPFDVYQCEWISPFSPHPRDSLYIKLRLNPEGTEISLVSFHLS